MSREVGYYWVRYKPDRHILDEQPPTTIALWFEEQWWFAGDHRSCLDKGITVLSERPIPFTT